MINYIFSFIVGIDMDLLGAGSIYYEIMYDLPENSNTSLEEILADSSEPDQILKKLKDVCRPLYHGIGGSSANTIYALSRLGYRVGYLGIVGNDEYSKEILSFFNGVDTRLIRKYESSGISVRIFHGKENTHLKFPNSNNYLSFIEDDLPIINSSNYIYLGPVENGSPVNSYKQLLNFIDESIYVFYAPGRECASLGLQKLGDIISKARVVFVTSSEVELLTSSDTHDGCKAMIEEGARVVVCMNDSDVSIISRHSDYTLPFKKTILKDNSDFLDAYIAGFLSAYVEGFDLDVCGNAGTTIAALTSTSYGRESYPNSKFLKNILP